MKRRVAALLLATAAMIGAQEGHPLVGSWHGSWGAGAQQNDATFVLDWDGKNITGLINPGLEAMRVENASLDADTWTVRLEANGKDAAGRAVRVVIEGKIQNVTNVRRSIVGTWTQGGVAAPLKMSRDY